MLVHNHSKDKKPWSLVVDKSKFSIQATLKWRAFVSTSLMVLSTDPEGRTFIRASPVKKLNE